MFPQLNETSASGLNSTVGPVNFEIGRRLIDFSYVYKYSNDKEHSMLLYSVNEELFHLMSRFSNYLLSYCLCLPPVAKCFNITWPEN